MAGVGCQVSGPLAGIEASANIQVLGDRCRVIGL
jgi:hypothetical protein